MLSETEAPPAAAATPSRPPFWVGLRPLLLRLHFYAGVLIAPFLLVAACTGVLYGASYQIEKVLYSDQLTVSQVGTAPRPLSEQVAAATAAHPEGSFALVRTYEDREATTQVLLNSPNVAEGNRLAVFVDPYTAKAQGAVESYGSTGALPLRATLDKLHTSLLLGESGRLYSELAASWLWVVVLGGVALWIGRRRKRYLRPGGKVTGRRRTLSWHGAVGLWAAIGLIGLSATGLTWSTYAGENVENLRTSLSWSTPSLSTAIGADHTGHQAADSGSGEAAPGSVGLDQVLAAARKAGLNGPLEITPPKPGKAYTVKEIDRQVPDRLDQVAVDPASGHITSRLDFADYPLAAKLTRYGIDLHMGLAFGLVNQLVLVALGLAVITLILLGYRMWWHRRPTGGAMGRPYTRGAWRQNPVAAVVLLLLAIPIGWFLPLFGLSLLAFLVVDVLLGLRRRAAA
ncbi:PepSY-associated TM helix domain-containing protein [Kitasatospora sp. NPDC051853]|uniref:PepSY-associated TM helix domain-containing protein n=1 Tax=Kitasatospora sp. NPDC051853 TaxID=3364058 RepID=UPI00379D644F